MAFTKTEPFGAPKVRLDYSKLDQGVANTTALVEGRKTFEKLCLQEGVSTLTGTQNDVNFDSLAVSPAVGVTYVQWNGASDLTITGIANGAGGRVYRIQNVTAAKALRFAHQNTGSTITNRILNPASVVSQAFGPGGVADVWYDSTQSRWRVAVLDEGDWIKVAYAGGNFTASGAMSWTVDSGDVGVQCYKQRGSQLVYSVQINTSSIGISVSTELRVALPDGLTIITGLGSFMPANASDNGTQQNPGWMGATGGNTYIWFKKQDLSNWTGSATNTTSCGGTFVLSAA
jgi:hypothetical protein